MTNGYKRYTQKTQYFSAYNAYQEKYRTTPRESDKVITSIIGDLIEGGSFSRDVRILDIGCSTGNLLRLLRSVFPEAHLTGSDLSTSCLDQCLASPDLAGVHFQQTDVLDLDVKSSFDIVILNAVSWVFDWDEFRLAMQNCFNNLDSNGALILFEWLNPFEHQDLRITETSIGHPEGMTYYIRPMRAVTQQLERIGFESISIRPFNLPIDLEFPGYDAELTSYTVRRDNGSRLCFRGSFFQPWSHTLARKP